MDLKEWLRVGGLGQYWQELSALGYDSLEFVQQMDDSEWTQMLVSAKIKPAHAQRFKRLIQEGKAELQGSGVGVASTTARSGASSSTASAKPAQQGYFASWRRTSTVTALPPAQPAAPVPQGQAQSYWRRTSAGKAVIADPSGGPSISMPDISGEAAAAYLSRAWEELQANRTGHAIAELTGALDEFPESEPCYKLRAFCHRLRNDNAHALEDLDRAGKLRPCAETFVFRGQVLRLLGDPGAAVQSYTHALVLEPGCIDALIGRGYCQILIGQYDAAITDLSAALAKQPENTLALANRAYAYAMKTKDPKNSDSALAEMSAQDCSQIVRISGHKLTPKIHEAMIASPEAPKPDAPKVVASTGGKGHESKRRLESQRSTASSKTEGTSPEKTSSPKLVEEVVEGRRTPKSHKRGAQGSRSRSLSRPKKDLAETFSETDEPTKRGQGKSTRLFVTPSTDKRARKIGATPERTGKLSRSTSDLGQQGQATSEAEFGVSPGGFESGKKNFESEIECEGPSGQGEALEVALEELKSTNGQLARTKQQVLELNQINSILEQENLELKRMLHKHSAQKPDVPQSPSASSPLRKATTGLGLGARLRGESRNRNAKQNPPAPLFAAPAAPPTPKK